MARLFLSHSSANNAAAVALNEWLAEIGYEDVFLDIDPVAGLAPGDRWQEALREAADRCEAVLFLVSPVWLTSRWCLAEFLLAKSLHKRIFGLVIEKVDIADVPVEMSAEWQLCDLTSTEQTRTFEITVFDRRETVTFPQYGLTLLRRGLERAGLDASSFPWPPPGDPDRTPYRGLSALDAEDAAIFFGRDAAIVRGLDSIRGILDGGVERVLVILGASGSGKSSFLRAGLWPRLARADTAFLPLPIIRPEVAAISGASGLVAALVNAYTNLGASYSPGRIKARLAEQGNPLGLIFDEMLDLVRRRLVGIDPEAPGPAIVIPIDQAEELFNPDGAAESALFFELLARAFNTEAGLRRRVLILATIRSDRYELLQSSERLNDIKRALFDLPPISPSEFKTVIEGPVRRLSASGHHFVIEPALTEQLIADSQGADALPLLAFTLERLYADFGSEGRLTLHHYDQIGRVKGSIDAAVNQALMQPGRQPVIPDSRDAQFARLRAAFIPWLARIDPETGATMRRVARFDEIPMESHGVIERLIEARLLVADRRSGIYVIEVAHESLLRQWAALTSWLEADREALKQIEGVDRAAKEWDGNGRHGPWLDHRAERLASADALANRPDFKRRLGEIGIAYLNACRVREDAEREEREQALVREQARLAQIAKTQRRFTVVLIASAVLVAIGIGAGGFLWKQLQDRQVSLNREQVELFAELAETQRLSQNYDGALRLAIYDAKLDASGVQSKNAPIARPELAAAFFQSGWRLNLSGHTGAVTSATFSPDGTQIATASNDKTARIWNAATGAPVLKLEGHQDTVSSAAFSADGKRIVTASSDTTARVWDATTGAQLLNLTGHHGPVTSAAFNNDGSRIVTSSDDQSAIEWNAETGAQILLLQRDKMGPVWTASFSKDGSRIVTASEDGYARVWDAQTGAVLAQVQGHAGGIWSAAFSPDGTQLVTASYDTKAIVWDIASGKQIDVLNGHQDWIMQAAFSPDGKKIVTASQDGTARVWDLGNCPSGACATVATLVGCEGGVLSAAFSPNGNTIVTASFDRTARLWDMSTGKPLVTLAGHTDKIWSAAFNLDGTRVVTASQDGTAIIWDAKTGAQIKALIGHQSWVQYAAFSPDGKKIVTASQDDTAIIWDANTGLPLLTLTGHDGGVLMAEFSGDGQRIVTASYDQTARIWDANTGKQLLVLRGHTTSVLSAAFSPDGTKVVTGAYDETARIWNATTGDVIQTLRGHTGGVWDAHFDPSGTRVVTASEDRTARIWDVATGAEMTTLRGHQDWVWSALFSSDGKRIVTGSQDQTARIWDASDGVEIGMIREIEGGIFFANFSPDGSEIVTASDDMMARIWNAGFLENSSADLVHDVCGNRLDGISTLTLDEMRLAGFGDSRPQIDVCATP